MLGSLSRPVVRLFFVLAPALGAFAEEHARDAAPGGLCDDDWASIQAAHEAHLHAAYPIDGGHRARSVGQQWTTHFDGRGFTVEPDGGGWTWGLELLHYGWAGAEQDGSTPIHVTCAGSRVAYTWNNQLVEWFVNDSRGLEHGYTLRERPARAAGSDGPLSFTLSVRGGLRAEVQAGGRGARFLDEVGAVVLTYTGLTVLDAEGHSLPARLEPAFAGLRLSVDERGASYPLTIDPVAQQAYLKASNTGANDQFGGAVSMSGDTVVVGALGEDSSATGVNGDQSNDDIPASGAAYVFVRSGTSWSQQAYLKASNTDTGDNFGFSVSIAGDTVVVGAVFEDGGSTGVDGDQSDDSAQDAGAAYVFVRTGTTWSQQAYLKASNTNANDHFGHRVTVSGDTVVVGAPRDGSSGSAYAFIRNGTSWSQQALLKASNAGVNDMFGHSVSVSGDTLVVAAIAEDSNATGVNGDQSNNSASGSGAAYVFVRSGTSWSQQAYLKASNTAVNDTFGSNVAVSGDTLAVGAIGEDSNATGVDGDQSNNDLSGAGAAYVFVRSGTSWSQQAYLKASNTDAGDVFGWVVSVSGDRVAVGAANEESGATGVNGNQVDNGSTNAGAAYVFIRSGATWSQQAYLKASNTDGGDSFGWSVSLEDDTLVVGSPGEASVATGVNGDQSSNGATDAGAVYVFLGGLPLAADVSAISLAAGGVQTFTLDAGAANAFGLYYMLTTTTGTSPGLALPPSALTLPLNFSGLLLFTALNPNLLIQSSLDFLDASGQRTATMPLAAGLDPGLAGVTLHHAYMLLELVGFTATFVSNPVPLALVP